MMDLRKAKQVELGFGSFLGLDHETRELAAFGHVAIAAVDDGVIASDLTHLLCRCLPSASAHETADAFIASLLENTSGWRDLLHARAMRAAVDHRTLVAISVSSYDPASAAVAMAYGPRQRRIDAVLDLLDVPYCGWDVLDAVDEVARALIASESSSSTIRDTLRTVRPVAEIVGAIHPFLGIPTTLAIDHFTKAEPDEPAADIPEGIFALARVLVACQKRPDGSSARARAREARTGVLSDMRRIAAESAARGCTVSSIEDGRFDVLHRAAAALVGAAGPVVGLHEVPELTGLGVPEVQRIAEAAGLRTIVVDGREKADGRKPGAGWTVVNEPVIANGNGMTVTAIPHSEAAPSSGRTAETEDPAAAPDARDCVFPGNASRSTLDKYWPRLRAVLPRGSKVVWFAGAMDMDALATQDALYLFSDTSMIESGGFRHVISFSEITRVEIGKEWFDWFVRVHRDNSTSVRFNLGGNNSLAERLRSEIESARARSKEQRSRANAT